jgi:hypothetical protein
MFAAMVRLQREPAGSGVVQPPGGRPTSIVLGWTGLATSVAAVLLACVPPPGEADGRRYVIMVVGLSGLLVASGVLAWVIGNARRRASAASA